MSLFRPQQTTQNNMATPWGAIASGVTGIASIFGAKSREKRQHEYNTQLADHKFDKDTQFWQNTFDQQNEYNTPVNQMGRYKDAGINPHMAYMSGGGSNTASTGQMGNYSQNNLEVSGSTAELGTGILAKHFENSNIQATIRSNKAKADQEEIQTKLMAQGLEKKLQTEDITTNKKNWQAKEDFDFTVQPKGIKTKKDGSEYTKYSQGLQDDYETKRLQKQVLKAEKTLKQITGSNLITNDQLIEMQTKIQKAQFDFIQSDWFKDLPPTVQAVFMGLGKLSGGL